MITARVLLFFIISLVSSFIYSQEITSAFGIKSGFSFSKYTPDNQSNDYDFKSGFYVGGFVKLQLDKTLSVQPELLFSLQGSKVTAKNIRLTDYAGVPIPNFAPFTLEYQIHDLTITVPIVGKLYFTKYFYMKSGPQFNFIIDRNFTSTQSLPDGSRSNFIVKEGEKFEFCVFVGLGYDISESISLNANVVSGLFKGEDEIMSSLYNFGVEYSF